MAKAPKDPCNPVQHQNMPCPTRASGMKRIERNDKSAMRSFKPTKGKK
jgi:hypothetical protein